MEVNIIYILVFNKLEGIKIFILIQLHKKISMFNFKS